MAKTLREQIKEIHSEHFSPEFHAHRGNNVPVMVNDLAMEFFDKMALGSDDFWIYENSRDFRAVKEARKHLASYALRDTIPAVE